MAGFDRYNRARARSRDAWSAGNIAVNASDLNALAADLTGAGEDVAPRAQVVVRKTLHEIEAGGKAFAPVDTGFLRSSIGTEVDGDGLGGIVGPSASYGAFVELGTSRNAPAAYMGPAFDRASPGFVAAMEQLGGDIL